MDHAGKESKNYHNKINDLKTWLSAVYSYQETCIDAFDKGDMKNQIKIAVNSSKQFVSNSLAIVSQISSILDNFNAAEAALTPKRHLAARTASPPPVDTLGFPPWMGRQLRKLVVKSTAHLVPDLIVAKDGTGNSTSINDCLRSLPENRTKR